MFRFWFVVKIPNTVRFPVTVIFAVAVIGPINTQFLPPVTVVAVVTVVLAELIIPSPIWCELMRD